MWRRKTCELSLWSALNFYNQKSGIYVGWSSQWFWETTMFWNIIHTGALLSCNQEDMFFELAPVLPLSFYSIGLTLIHTLTLRHITHRNCSECDSGEADACSGCSCALCGPIPLHTASTWLCNYGTQAIHSFFLLKIVSQILFSHSKAIGSSMHAS
jgi:hypothetical protein